MEQLLNGNSGEGPPDGIGKSKNKKKKKKGKGKSNRQSGETQDSNEVGGAGSLNKQTALAMVQAPLGMSNCAYCHDKCWVKFTDMLTYPRPIRKFKVRSKTLNPDRLGKLFSRLSPPSVQPALTILTDFIVSPLAAYCTHYHGKDAS